jgi:hypothetical protein
MAATATPRSSIAAINFSVGPSSAKDAVYHCPRLHSQPSFPQFVSSVSYIIVRSDLIICPAFRYWHSWRVKAPLVYLRVRLWQRV